MIDLTALQSKMIAHRAKGNELQRKMIEVEKGNYDKEQWTKEYELHSIASTQILNEINEAKKICQNL